MNNHPLNFDLKTQFEKVWVKKSVNQSAIAKRASQVFSCGTEEVEDKPFSDQTVARLSHLGKSSGLSPEEFSKSKRQLFITEHEGHFFRKCPGTQGAACCNYYVLNLGLQCPMNCSYCYLQSYINTPYSMVFTNIDKALNELEQNVKAFPNAPFRVGTGEVIDSLALDDLTLHSQLLVDWFSKYPQLTLEFKTKTNNVKNFVEMKHAGNVVVSFSVNPEAIVTSEEHFTSSCAQRLEAARLARDKGFTVAFHIDPMIYVEGWRDLYGGLVKQIAQMFTPDEVKWVSVGALRFPPPQKNVMRERFGFNNLVNAAELFLSDDGKLRYDMSLRQTMFKFVIDEFRNQSPLYKVFLCMEAPETWMGVSGQLSPRRVEGLEELFKPVASI